MKRRLLLLALLATQLAAVISCAAKSPVAFANRFIEAEKKAWGTGDLSDLKAIEADDVIYHMPDMELKGWSAHEAYIQQGRALVSDLKQEWKYLSGEGSHFILSYMATGVMRTDANSSPTPMSVSFLWAFRTSNGKIAEVWVNGSTATPSANTANKE